MAQLVAQAICNRQVVGSSPTTGSTRVPSRDDGGTAPARLPGESLPAVEGTVASGAMARPFVQACPATDRPQG